MATILRTSWPWLLINMVGLSLFIYFSSWLWAPRGQEGLLGGPGDNVIWLYTVFPLLALCGSLDLIWCMRILAQPRWSARWPLLVLWLLVVACWVSVQSYNRSRSFTGADVSEAFSSP